MAFLAFQLFQGAGNPLTFHIIFLRIKYVKKTSRWGNEVLLFNRVSHDIVCYLENTGYKSERGKMQLQLLLVYCHQNVLINANELGVS